MDEVEIMCVTLSAKEGTHEFDMLTCLGCSAKERHYRNRDEISVSKEGLGDLYESKLKGFFRFVYPILPFRSPVPHLSHIARMGIVS
jgi:hypothetical protein